LILGVRGLDMGRLCLAVGWLDLLLLRISGKGW
jgi:hypothetical protein